MLRPNSRSCRTASIRSGIAGGLAGELGHARCGTAGRRADIEAPLGDRREGREHSLGINEAIN